jgi:small subunit ribosomal protein S6
MFLFDSAVIGDLAAAKAEVERILKRAEAEIIVCRRWDERKLAYSIGGCKRGLYLLAFFRADPLRVREIERDIRLSEKVVRAMVLKADWMTEARMHEMLPEKLDHFTPQPSAPVESERSRPREEEEFEGADAVTIDADVTPAGRG